MDGANRISSLIRRAREFEMPALALTDHGCMYGAWEFQQQATKAGIKPIVGMEAYVAPGDRRERRVVEKGERNYYHLILLARDLEGYRNLIKLTSIGYLEGFYHRPRIDRETLAAHSRGLIVSSACLAGEVARHLMAENWGAAREAAAWYANTFDGRYYLEVQAHDSEGQASLNEKIFQLAGEVGLPVVATNDAHFLRREDHEAHDILLCIGLGKDRSDANRMRYDSGLYFKSAPEIAERFPDHPEVLTNTLAVADQVDVHVKKQYYVPSFPLPAGVATEAEELRRLTWEKAGEHFGTPLSAEIAQRIEYELGVITSPKADYSGYFLITQDFINWAKQNGIPVGPGRGSAAGSMVAFVLGITDVDPLKFDLLFERFLNPDRVSMPDIDIDFCFERRGEVIEYVRQKYGKQSVGQIITFGTMKSRAVIKDVGRVLGFEPAETDRLAKLVPNAPNYSMTVAEAAEKIHELRELIETDPRVAQLVEFAKALEGLSRHSSVHAAGVVIAPGPLDEYVPVCTQPTKGAGRSNGNGASAGGSGTGTGKGKGEGEGGDELTLVTQWDMNALEQAGMLKMDFLGLKTLTVIHDAVKWIVRRHGALKHPESGKTYRRVEDVELDDPAVFEMVARGGTTGVFQFESSLATEKLRAMRCDRFEDLVATNALIRPGPLDSGMTDVYIRRKTGKEKVTYPLAELEPVLEATYGVIIYQEQVMRIAQLLAGFTLAEADVLRKAVGKKDAELIRKELGKFASRSVDRGFDKRIIDDLAEQIQTFGRYGFNRAHAVAYTLISYQTAWLKRHYPAEFMAALLSSVVDKTEDVVNYIGACRDLWRYVTQSPGLEVLAPDVNESEWKFTPVSDTQIRFGLGAIRGLGEGAVTSILEARASGGEFSSLFDLVERCDLRALNRRALEALIMAGACDRFGHRAQLATGMELALREAQVRQAEAEAGQASLFDAFGGGPAAPAAQRPAPQLPDVAPWPESERLAREKETLGFFISGHPLDKYRDEVRVFQAVNTANLKSYREQKVELAVVVTAVSRQISKKNGAEWGRVTVEDFYGTASVLVFGETWEMNRDILLQDAVLLLRGTVRGREDEESPPLFLDEAAHLASLRTRGVLGLELRLPAGEGDAGIEEATRLLRGSPGPAPLFVQWLHTPGNGRAGGAPDAPPRLRSRGITVAPDEPLLRRLRELFGDDQVRLVRS